MTNCAVTTAVSCVLKGFGFLPRHVALFWLQLTSAQGRERNNKLIFPWPKMACLGPPFLTNNPSHYFYVDPSFASFPTKFRHINFFRGAQDGVFWAWAQKLKLKKFMIPQCMILPAVARIGRTLPSSNA